MKWEGCGGKQSQSILRYSRLPEGTEENCEDM
jgi:hypothetical protein